MKLRAILRSLTLSAALVFGIAVGCTRPPPPHTSKPVELKAVSVAQLEGEIASHKGKVVLIDVWFLGCDPCVKRFPKFVELHRELASEGLVAISLKVEPKEEKRKEQVLDFLKQQGADGINLIVEDDEKTLDDWQMKYDARATPSYVIFDRAGRWVRTPQPEDKENITRILKKLLSEK